MGSVSPSAPLVTACLSYLFYLSHLASCKDASLPCPCSSPPPCAWPLWERPSPRSWSHTPWLLPKPMPLQRPLQRRRNCRRLRLPAGFHWGRGELMPPSTNPTSSTSACAKEPLHWGLRLRCSLQGGERNSSMPLSRIKICPSGYV